MFPEQRLWHLRACLTTQGPDASTFQSKELSLLSSSRRPVNLIASVPPVHRCWATPWTFCASSNVFVTHKKYAFLVHKLYTELGRPWAGGVSCKACADDAKVATLRTINPALSAHVQLTQTIA